MSGLFRNYRKLLSYLWNGKGVRRSNGRDNGSGARGRLLLYGLVGFLWERERISNEEILSAVQDTNLFKDKMPVAQMDSYLSTQSGRVPIDSGKSLLSMSNGARSDVVRCRPVLQRPPAGHPAVRGKHRNTSVMDNKSKIRRKSSLTQCSKDKQMKVGHIHSETAAPSLSSANHLKDVCSGVTEGSSVNRNEIIGNNETVSPMTIEQGGNASGMTVGWSEQVAGMVYGWYTLLLGYLATPAQATTNDITSDNKPIDTGSILLTDDPSALVAHYFGEKSAKPVSNDWLFPMFCFAGDLPNESLQAVQTVDLLVGKLLSFADRHNLTLPTSHLMEEAMVGGGFVMLFPSPAVQQRAILIPPVESTESVPRVAPFVEKTDDQSEGWNLVHRSGSTDIFSRPYGDAGLTQYKVTGQFHDITARDFLAVQTIPAVRKSWDEYTNKMTVLDEDTETHTQLVHWIVKFPFPFSNRDYLFVRREIVRPDCVLLINRTTKTESVPPDSGCVRVDTYHSKLAVWANTTVDENGFLFQLTYVDDLKCNLPSSMVSWASTTGVIEFLNKARSQALARSKSASTGIKYLN